MMIIYTGVFIPEISIVMNNWKQLESPSMWYYLLNSGIVKKIKIRNAKQLFKTREMRVVTAEEKELRGG